MTRAPPGAHRPTHISLECAIRAQVLYKKAKQVYKMVSCLLTVTQSTSGTSTARTDRRPSDGRDPFIALKALHGTFTCKVLYGAAVLIKCWAKPNVREMKTADSSFTGTTGRQAHHWPCLARIETLLTCPVLNTSRSGRSTGHKFPP